MTITNKYGLPEAMVEAVRRNEHRAGTYSASMLSKSPRQVLLERRHDAEIVEDVSDRLWSLFGTAMHKILEMGQGAHDLGEGYMEQEVAPGVTVSGTSDLYNGQSQLVSDYKTTSAWTVVYGSRTDEWTKQLNVYAWLFRHLGFPVVGLRVIAMLRDWQRSKAAHDARYPQVQTVEIALRLWSEAEQLAYIMERVNLFESNKNVPDDELPLCSAEDRWQDVDKYAVMKPGRKSAVRVLDSYSDAVGMAANLDGGHYVQARTGEPRRCADYCPAAPWCNQYQAEVKQLKGEAA